MPLHIKKLSVGSESVASLAEWQTQRLANEGRLLHVTRAFPKRAEEVLAGGSIYWVIKKAIRARQVIDGLEVVLRDDGKKACAIVLRPGLIKVVPRRARPFQGWRYLPASDAPPDIPPDGKPKLGDTPAGVDEMHEELRELGLL